MKKDIIIKKLEELGEDVVYIDFTDVSNYIGVDFNDFGGFDDNWDEIPRKYDNKEKVIEFQNFLKNNALSIDKKFYTTYYFNGFNVVTGFTSYDI